LIIGAKPKIVKRITGASIRRLQRAMSTRDYNKALKAASELTAYRNQSQGAPDETRSIISDALSTAGLDLTSSYSVDEQFGAILGSISGKSNQDITNELRAMTGLYDQGVRGRDDFAARQELQTPDNGGNQPG
jgi:hypothetical protein